jgi:hypothetical protein
VISIITGQDQMVAEWASEQLKQPIVPPYVAIGFAKGDELDGAAVFNDFNGANIELTIYGPGCLTPATIKYVFEYAFRQLGVARVTARTRRGNAVMRKLLPRLGFSFEGTAKRYFGTDKADDALLFALFPEAARKWMQ